MFFKKLIYNNVLFFNAVVDFNNKYGWLNQSNRPILFLIEKLCIKNNIVIYLKHI